LPAVKDQESIASSTSISSLDSSADSSAVFQPPTIPIVSSASSHHHPITLPSPIVQNNTTYSINNHTHQHQHRYNDDFDGGDDEQKPPALGSSSKSG
jgi:hypothetical protein